MRAWALILAAVASLAAADPVEVDGLWLLDSARERNLGLKVYHPSEPSASLPVVLFSHGLGGSQWGYAYLGKVLAARGCVVIHVTHPGSDWLLWDGKGYGEAMANLRRALEDPAIWRERPRDLAFLADRLGEIEARVPALAGRLDAGRLIAAGHSLGAYTALAGIGLAPALPDEVPALADPRLRAAIALSPPGPGGFLPIAGWAGVSRPVLLVTGTDDDQPLAGSGKGLAWRLEGWEALVQVERHLLILAGAGHMTFAGGGLGERARPEHLAAVAEACAGFIASVLDGGSWQPASAPGLEWRHAAPAPRP
jgi:predicted dienelactone hydrolase